MNFTTKKLFLGIPLLLIVLLSSCEKKHLCPTYMSRDNGTVSVVDGAQTAEEVQKQSLEKLGDMNYVRIKRDKKTGLVSKTKRFKRKIRRGKNITNSRKRKDYKVAPTMKGLDQ